MKPLRPNCTGAGIRGGRRPKHLRTDKAELERVIRALYELGIGSRIAGRMLGYSHAQVHNYASEWELPPPNHVKQAEWFESLLPVPDRFNRTKSKGWYRRQTRGISWLRVTAVDHVASMKRLAEVVTQCGYQVAELRTDRVGYVTYEDEVQVVAEPFRETPTR